MNFRFDYMPDGKTIDSGIEFDLTEDNMKNPAATIEKIIGPAFHLLMYQIENKVQMKQIKENRLKAE